jgi:hypothetical protein
MILAPVCQWQDANSSLIAFIFAANLYNIAVKLALLNSLHPLPTQARRVIDLV